jgi:S-adenosylmethionine decarboxylase
MLNHAGPVLYAVDLAGCATLSRLEPAAISEAFSSALGRAGATIVQTMSHTYPGAGLTCVLVLQESHAVLHTWPETGTVNIDIFSCAASLKSADAVRELSLAFGARHVAVQEIPRTDGHRPIPLGGRVEPSRLRLVSRTPKR